MIHNESLPADWYPLISRRPQFTLAHRAGIAAAVTVGLGLLNYFAPGHPTLEMRILASAIIVAGLYPTWRWLAGNDRSLPFMPFLGLLFVMYYSFPLFLLERYAAMFGGHPIPSSWLVKALALSLTSLILILAGYYGSAGLIEQVMPRAKMKWVNLGHCKLLAILLGFLGLGVFAVGHVLKVGDAGAQFIAYLGDLSLVSIAMLFVLQLTGRLDRLTTLTLWCFLVPARMLLGFSDALTQEGLMVALLLLFTYSAVRRKMSWRWIAVGALSIFLIRPVMIPMRALTYKGGPLYGASLAKKVTIFLHLMVKGAARPVPYQVLLQFTASRMAETQLFAVVVHETPRIVAYWNGGSYAPLLYKFVPRFLDPDKPVDDSGQSFGHRYRLIALEDHITSVNMAQTIELYANYGAIGIILGSLLFGVVYRVIHSIFVHPEMGFGALVGAFVMFSRLFSIESGASSVLGGVLWSFVFVGLINLVMELGELREDVQGLDAARAQREPWNPYRSGS